MSTRCAVSPTNVQLFCLDNGQGRHQVRAVLENGKLENGKRKLLTTLEFDVLANPQMQSNPCDCTNHRRVTRWHFSSNRTYGLKLSSDVDVQSFYGGVREHYANVLTCSRHCRRGFFFSLLWRSPHIHLVTCTLYIAITCIVDMFSAENCWPRGLEANVEHLLRRISSHFFVLGNSRRSRHESFNVKRMREKIPCSRG